MKRGFRGKVMTASSGGEDLRYLEDGLLVFGDDGRITSVEPFGGPPDGVLVRDVRPFLLAAGFVDAHLHYPQTRVIGSATGPLLPWLERTVFPEEARFLDERHATAVAAELTRRLALAGTTTAVLYSSSDPRATRVLFEALARSGHRGFVGLTLMDQHCPEPLRVDADHALAACAELASAYHGHDRGRLAFVITPRFAPTCSRALLEGAGRLAEERGLFVQTHISENADECRAALALHPFASDYLDIYDRTGLLGERTLLAHAIHLSPGEWDRVRARGARIAHCPDSNFFLGSGRMRLAEARARGIPVALGTDVAAGRTFDVRRIMSSAYDNATCLGDPITPEALFRLGTLGGAEALGIARETGSLEPGKDADFCVIELPDYVEGRSDVLSRIVFSSDTTPVRETYVRGKRVEGG
ncbi:guanine deaminase [Polyangium spumosum]|nr:guanine deaminase [Polyangium spumosum]